MQINPILKTDSYKASHYAAFPPGTTNAYYYLESRGGRYGALPFFGLQGFLRDYLSGRFCENSDIDDAADFFSRHGEPFNESGWRKIADQRKHGGNLPVRIKAVKEGTVVPTHSPMLTCESTDPELAWLPSWIETMLMRGVWYPTTVCARSYACKQVIHRYLTETANAPLAELPFKLHDFGARGVSSAESAAIGGAAHLVNFKGSDTAEGIAWMQYHYGSGSDGIPAFSIPAMEHSTVLAWGRRGEIDAYRNMLSQFAKPGKILACVSDTYDYWETVENIWCGELRDEVAKSGAIIVIRPDSGHPPEVVLKTVQAIARKCGSEKNLRGYTVLPSFFRVIQGDGNDDEDSIEAILHELTSHGFSASNVAFGMGGGLLQKLDRDTQKFAYKMSEVTVGGEVRAVRKEPKTDMGKASKSGRFSLVVQDGKLTTVAGDNAPGDMLETVFENGVVTRHQDLDEVRKLAGKEFT